MILMAAHPIEERFVEQKQERRRKYESAHRKRIRASEKPSPEDVESLSRAPQMFDVRWLGWMKSRSKFPAFTWMLTVEAYIKFRTRVGLRPREWQALITAAYKAAGRTVQIDGSRLKRNLRKLAANHPHLIPTGPKAAEIIEIGRGRY